MWRSGGYENKLVWVLVILVIMVLALTLVWLRQSNLVTFGVKHSDSNSCSGITEENRNSASGTAAGKCGDSEPAN